MLLKGRLKTFFQTAFSIRRPLWWIRFAVDLFLAADISELVRSANSLLVVWFAPSDSATAAGKIHSGLPAVPLWRQEAFYSVQVTESGNLTEKSDWQTLDVADTGGFSIKAWFVYISQFVTLHFPIKTTVKGKYV